MSWTRRFSAVGFSLLLLAGVSCTSSDTALTEAPVAASEQPQPQFGLIGDLTGGLTSTGDNVTNTVVGTLGSGRVTCSTVPPPYDTTTPKRSQTRGCHQIRRRELRLCGSDRASHISAAKLQVNTVPMSSAVC